MKKKLFLALLAPFIMFTAHADEGMWTLYNLPTAVYDQMKQYGFLLPMEQLYQTDNAVKNAVINFSGYCSGVVVSPNGLVFTNHHCGFDAIRRHSTVEHPMRSVSPTNSKKSHENNAPYDALARHCNTIYAELSSFRSIEGIRNITLFSMP